MPDTFTPGTEVIVNHYGNAKRAVICAVDCSKSSNTLDILVEFLPSRKRAFVSPDQITHITTQSQISKH